MNTPLTAASSGDQYRLTVRGVRYVPAAIEHRGQILDLFAAVTAADPDYVPVVTDGTETLAQWFDRKSRDWGCLALDTDDRVIGHVSTRRNQTLPGGALTPPNRNQEMGRLAVHPDWEGNGIGTSLVRCAHDRYGATLWATCHTGYTSHRLMARLGWTDHLPVGWADDPRPGICLFAPTTTRAVDGPLYTDGADGEVTP